MSSDSQSNLCQFAKTKMCKFHVVKRCTKGAQCPFAHDPLELRNQPDLRCTKLCKTFTQTGQCSNKSCAYAHGKEELRSTGAFHKTKLCRYRQTGHCSLGGKCNFAHSQHELREPDVNDSLMPPSEIENNSLFQAKAPPGLGWDSFFNFLQDDDAEEESFVSSAGSSDTVDERDSKVVQGRNVTSGKTMESGILVQDHPVDPGSFGDFQNELGYQDYGCFQMGSSGYEDCGNIAYTDWTGTGIGDPMQYDTSAYSYGDYGSWDWQQQFTNNVVL